MFNGFEGRVRGTRMWNMGKRRTMDALIQLQVGFNYELSREEERRMNRGLGGLGYGLAGEFLAGGGARGGFTFPPQPLQNE